MTHAEDAFKRARDKIIAARDSGAERLSLGDTAYHALTRLPGEIADCTGLRSLDLGRTQVSDLSLLSGLTKLKRLNLNYSQVSDLRPIAALDGLATGGPLSGVFFEAIPALEHDPTMKPLSAIEDDQQRTRLTLAYLGTLPAQDPDTTGDLTKETDQDPLIAVASHTPAPPQVPNDMPRTIATAAAASLHIKGLIDGAPLYGNTYAPLLHHAHSVAISLDQIAAVSLISDIPAQIVAMQARIAELEDQLGQLTDLLRDKETRLRAAEDLAIALQTQIARGNSLRESALQGAAIATGAGAVTALFTGIYVFAHALLGDDNLALREYHEMMGHAVEEVDPNTPDDTPSTKPDAPTARAASQK